MIGWLIETLVAVTLLMLMVLLLRGPVARSFGSGWAYALWAVPALRLVVPPLPRLAPDLSIPSAVDFIPKAAEMTASLPAEAGPGQWVPFMLAMWAGGAVIFLILQWLAYRAFLGRIRTTSRPARPPFFGGIRTWISEAVDGPLALGIVERRIVLPGDFSRRYNPVERRLALEHELVHHKRGDIWWNLAATIVLALLWFNPVAWIAFRAFRSDQELACDAAVARLASLDERCAYARALVKSASRPGLIAACAFNPAGELKRRLRMMRSHRSGRLRSAGGMAALSAFAALGLAMGAAAPPAIRQIEMAGAVAPAAAAAQVEPAPGPAPTAAKVAAARRPVRPAARPGAEALRAEPMSFASAEAPELPTALSSMALLRHLPRAAQGAAPRVARVFAIAVPAGAELRERRLLQVGGDEAEAQLIMLSERLSPEDAALLRRAVSEAVAQGRTLKFRLDRRQGPGGGGGGDHFDFNIQTIIKGE